jgi:hypothetical protein
MDKNGTQSEGLGMIFWSAMTMMVGFLIMIFAATLRNYRSSTSYGTALHAHVPAGIIFIVGIVVALFGVFGIVLSLMRRTA